MDGSASAFSANSGPTPAGSPIVIAMIGLFIKLNAELPP
jgi:hypothetical protein